MAVIELSWGQSLTPSEERDKLGMWNLQGILERDLCKEFLLCLGWKAQFTELLPWGRAREDKGRVERDEGER